MCQMYQVRPSKDSRKGIIALILANVGVHFQAVPKVHFLSGRSPQYGLRIE